MVINMHYMISTISKSDNVLFYLTKNWKVEAESLEEALHIFRQEHPDEIVLEIREEYKA